MLSSAEMHVINRCCKTKKWVISQCVCISLQLVLANGSALVPGTDSLKFLLAVVYVINYCSEALKIAI